MTPPGGRVLAVDYGAKRTGLAISDAAGIAAHPLPAVESEDLDATVAAIAKLAEEREAASVLVGMPYLPSGLEGAQVDRVRLFVAALRARLPASVPIRERDERFTTHAAERMWREAGVSARKARGFLDSTAAVLLLRDYLEEAQRTRS